MFDISLCSYEKCPKWNDCIRGGGDNTPGIYTISNFADECNEINNYAWMIPKDYRDWKEKL